MSALTRRREADRHQKTWHLYFGDTFVGMIGKRTGVPHDVDQWGWRTGFYPVDHRPGQHPGCMAAIFEKARADFDAA